MKKAKMDEDHHHPLPLPPPRKLDLSTPLLSTRHKHNHVSSSQYCPNISCCNYGGKSNCFAGVPFSWEEVPGKPRGELTVRKRSIVSSSSSGGGDPNNNLLLDDDDDDYYLRKPLPKPPPIRVYYCAATEGYHSASTLDKWGNINNCRLYDATSYDDELDLDRDHDGQVDSCSSTDHDHHPSEERGGDILSGTLDLFSLAESWNMDDNVNDIGGGEEYCPSPPPLSFMMERFLPAAIAIAVSSSSSTSTVSYPQSCSYIDKHRQRSCGRSLDGYCHKREREGIVGCMPRRRRVSPSSSSSPPSLVEMKSCGIDKYLLLLLPWRRGKHHICGAEMEKEEKQNRKSHVTLTRFVSSDTNTHSSSLHQPKAQLQLDTHQ